MAALVLKTKLFDAEHNTPSTPPDGTSLEEKVNVFLATLDQKNFLDASFNSELSGKYGTNQWHFATVIYKG